MMPKRKIRNNTSPGCFRMWKRRRTSSTLSENEKTELDTLFAKHFKYSSLKDTPSDETEVKHTSHTQSHRVEDFFLIAQDNSALEWQDEDLMSLKKEMNNLKSQLSDKDIEQWHAHTTACNLAGKILPYVKTLHVELCTQAWVKFYEILSAFKIVPNADFYSLHLCEAPGAFIAALNHYLQQQAFPHSWGWRATTLNPYYEANSPDEMIADDRLFRHTYSQCYFGPDGSGDIRADGHIAGIHNMAKELEKKGDTQILLVTADGSRDCQINPAEQESLLSQLHYCEMIAACLILAAGGNFVLKVFTMFETSTISLLFLLNIMFEEVHAFKPATSKSGNSETYLICLNFQKNVTDQTLWRMLASVLDSNITCFIRPSQLPTRFLEEHKSCCQKFAHWQASTIRRNMRLFELEDQEAIKQEESLQNCQEAAVDMFLERTSIVHSPHFKRLINNPLEVSSFTAFKSDILPGSRHSHCRRFQGHRKDLKGTFYLRQNLNSMSFFERITLMSPKDNFQPDTVLTIRCSLEDSEVKDLQCLEKAQRFDVIRSSHLCAEELLNDLNTMFKHAEISECQAKSEHNHARSLAELLVTILKDISAKGKHHQEDVWRSQHSSPPIPPGQHRMSISEDSEMQTLRPEWNKHQNSWSCSLSSSSPSKKPFPHGKESEFLERTDCGASSLMPLGHRENILYWAKETERENDSEFENKLKELLSPHPFTLSLLSLTTDAEELKSLEKGSYFLMDLMLLSHKPHPRDAKCHHAELLTKRTCVNKVLWAFQHMPLGGRLVLLTTTLLTRFSAGLVYLLARCFHTTSIRSSTDVWLHQFLVLEDFQGVSDLVIQHLNNLKSALEEEDQDGNSTDTLVEFVKFRHILHDRKFVQFLTSHNNFLMTSFINIILRHYGQS